MAHLGEGTQTQQGHTEYIHHTGGNNHKENTMNLVELYTPTEEGEDMFDDWNAVACGWDKTTRLYDFLCDDKYLDDLLTWVKASGQPMSVTSRTSDDEEPICHFDNTEG